jgi:hypothetical protein
VVQRAVQSFAGQAEETTGDEQVTEGEELVEIARAIIETNRYMTPGTADQRGRPWVSPVWYAPAGYREFLWVSDSEALHSRNLAGGRGRTCGRPPRVACTAPSAASTSSATGTTSARR